MLLITYAALLALVSAAQTYGLGYDAYGNVYDAYGQAHPHFSNDAWFSIPANAIFSEFPTHQNAFAGYTCWYEPDAVLGGYNSVLQCADVYGNRLAGNALGQWVFADAYGGRTYYANMAPEQFVGYYAVMM